MTPASESSGDAAESGPTTEGYRVETVSLLREPGSRRTVHLDEALTDLSTSGADAERVEGDLVVESMSDSLSVTGSLDLHWRGDCRRCLESTAGTSTVGIGEIFQRGATEGETFELTDDYVDLEPMVRELLYLALPLAPLCSEDCSGPAPDKFPAVVESAMGGTAGTGDEDAEVSVGDPRWSVLDELVFEPEERNQPGTG
ncbi:MAG: YceD family protein [Acidimicrobiales bacterium]